MLIILLLVITCLLLFFEFFTHRSRLNSIPIRIHVNGTRGKSSVTRLIAGALREHGLRTFAKTTGTLPRMIMHDGKEYPVYRPSRANIIEQLRIIDFAASNKAEVIVIECMALQPFLQWLAEKKIVRATHGVITNARADHLDVMGPTEKDVALALLGSTPEKGILFTAEQDYIDLFQNACKDRKSILNVVSNEDILAVTDQDMDGFSYVEHKENVALCLNVCKELGVDKKTALAGMYKAAPDPGVMTEYEVDFFGRRIIFINGFAANDPESSERIWNMALEKHQDLSKKIMILNSRFDRPDRSKQLGEAMVNWPAADHILLMGTGVYVLYRIAVSQGMESSQFVYAEGLKVSQIFEEIIGLAGSSAMVMGIGNIGGQGLELVNYFRNRSILRS